ncbi:HBL/NHE enterotoxin family protein [Aneurinibacillus migulanus]|uniref:HBL/NHE enterotoxin family protein n=1 Tax=Aneurinibacillus migulanus TaxID=47500 RepID=UPI002E1E46BA|nr:HBL/NHE enterotoxin family protein [Aneurinibacillus migulanus]MED4728372.1 HBL/NHE enterotoxin family protein [Aneurinibacillus migulanus]
MSTATLLSTLAPSNLSLTQENLTDYLNACNIVSAYSYAFNKSSIKPLNNPPSWYSDFVSEFGVAKGHANEWNDSLIDNMMEIPRAIVDGNRIIQAKFRNITSDLKDLKKDPNDQDVLDDLNTNLQRIYDRANDEYESICGLIDDFNRYQNTLLTDYNTLSQNIVKLNEASEADKDAVMKLQNEIDSLTQEIQTYNQILTASEIGIGVSIFVSLVGVVAGFATGGAAWAIVPVGVIGIGASVAGTVLASEKIREAQIRIGQDTANMSSYNQDLTVLNVEVNNLKQLNAKNQDAQRALVDVSKLWKDLRDSSSTLLQALTQTKSDVINDLDKAVKDIEDAQNDWNELENFAVKMTNIDYKFSPSVQTIK